MARQVFMPGARKWVVALLLCVQVLTASGMPLPAIGLPTGKDKSSPFPCMNRTCGCMTAEQCWRSCCCFTNQQKLEWAREHGVAVPDYVQDEEEPQGCTSCCCKKATTDKGSPYPIGVKSKPCRGSSPLAFFAEWPTLPPTFPTRPTGLILDSFNSISFDGDRPVAVSYSPPVPPPRGV